MGNWPPRVSPIPQGTPAASAAALRSFERLFAKISSELGASHPDWDFGWKFGDVPAQPSQLVLMLHDRVVGYGVRLPIDIEQFMHAGDSASLVRCVRNAVTGMEHSLLSGIAGEREKEDKAIALKQLGKERGAKMADFQKVQSFFSEAAREYRHQHPTELLEIGFDLPTDMVVFHLTGGAPVASKVHARIPFERIAQFVKTDGRVNGVGLETYIQTQLKHLRPVLLAKIEKEKATITTAVISEEGEEEDMTQVMSPLGASRKRTIRRPPQRTIKTKRIMCPTHDVPLVYNEDRGLWKCTQSKCRIIHRPKVDTDNNGGAGHLGQGALDIRIAVTQDKPGVYTQAVFLVAENGVAIDVTDYLKPASLSTGVSGAIAAAKTPGQPAYVDHQGGVFPIRVPRVVVISGDK